jgi:hypothetical protein
MLPVFIIVCMKFTKRSEWENIAILVSAVGLLIYLAARIAEQWDMILIGPVIMLGALVALFIFYRRRTHGP